MDPRLNLQLDELNKALLIAAAVSAAVSFIFSGMVGVSTAARALMVILLGIALYRQFSRDRNRRYDENQKWLTMITEIETRRRGFRDRLAGVFQKKGPSAGSSAAEGAKKKNSMPSWEELKQYKYFLCPQCGRRLRVPRGKGKIRITCTNCGNKFPGKS